MTSRTATRLPLAWYFCSCRVMFSFIFISFLSGFLFSFLQLFKRSSSPPPPSPRCLLVILFQKKRENNVENQMLVWVEMFKNWFLSKWRFSINWFLSKFAWLQSLLHPQFDTSLNDFDPHQRSQRHKKVYTSSFIDYWWEITENTSDDSMSDMDHFSICQYCNQFEKLGLMYNDEYSSEVWLSCLFVFFFYCSHYSKSLFSSELYWLV